MPLIKSLTKPAEVVLTLVYITSDWWSWLQADAALVLTVSLRQVLRVIGIDDYRLLIHFVPNYRTPDVTAGAVYSRSTT